MSELRSRILEACTLPFRGVTGVTHVTDPGRRANLPSCYACYACYAPLEQNPEKDGAGDRLQGPSSARLGWDAADWQACFEERAAIREYDGPPAGGGGSRPAGCPEPMGCRSTLPIPTTV